MSITRKIAEGTVIYTIGNLINNLFGFLTAFFLIRALGKFEYGLLVLALSSFAIATIFLDMGSLALLPSEIARYKNKNPYIIKNILREYSIQQLLFSLIIFTLLFIAGFFIRNIYNESITLLLWIVSIMVLLKAIDNIFSVTFYGYMKFKLHQGIEVLSNSIRCVFAFLIFYFDEGVLYAMSIYPISLLISIIFFSPFFWRIIKSIPIQPNYQAKSKSILIDIYKKHGKFVVANVPLKKLRAELPLWIIQYILNVEAVAIFSVAQKMFQFFNILFLPLNKVFFPLFSELYSSDINKIYKISVKSIKYTGLIAFIFFIFGFSLMPNLFNILFPKYFEGITIARILLVTLLLMPLSIVLGPLLYALRAQRYLFFANLLITPIYFFLLYLLTKMYGLIGSAISLILSSLAIIIIVYSHIIKQYPEMHGFWREIFKIDKYDKEIINKIINKIKHFEVK